MGYIEVDPRSQTSTENYKILIGSILPRPIAVVGTRNDNGSNNVAPFSFFNGVCSDPMIISFCPVLKDNGDKKDTLKNIERAKCFTINFATKTNMKMVNIAATGLDYGEDEFVLSGLTAIDSHTIDAPRVKESPIQFECKLRDILSYGEGKQGSGFLVTGEVVKIHILDDYFQNGRINQDLYQVVGRGAGRDWIFTDHKTQINRLSKEKAKKS